MIEKSMQSIQKGSVSSMSVRRKTFQNYDGFTIHENVCKDYVCRHCGQKASYCNYVGDICLQAFVPHTPGCQSFVNNERYSGYDTSCATCLYNDAAELCTLDSMEKERKNA